MFGFFRSGFEEEDRFGLVGSVFALRGGVEVEAITDVAFVGGGNEDRVRQLGGGLFYGRVDRLVVGRFQEAAETAKDDREVRLAEIRAKPGDQGNETILV